MRGRGPGGKTTTTKQMKANFLQVGVDVGSQELVVALRSGDRLRTFAVPNDPIGRSRLVSEALRAAGTALAIRVTVEATGIYSLELALLLSKTERFEVSVVNPKTIKHFLRAQGARGKTDKIDAAGILHYAELMAFRPWIAPAPIYLALQAIARRIYQLNAERVREKNRLAGIAVLGPSGKTVAADLCLAIRQIDQRIEKLEASALALINSEPALQRKYQLITSVKGIADKTAIRLLGEILVMDPTMKGPQWVAHAGLDPRPRQSGTSLDGHRYISKAGNRYIRSALYMPALVAIRREPTIGKRYHHMVDQRHKPRMIAVVTTMRKLLLSIHGMLKSDTPFDPAKLGPIPTELANQAV
jgi:transposase